MVCIDLELYASACPKSSSEEQRDIHFPRRGASQHTDPNRVIISTMDPLSRISVDPAVCFGKPCIRGTRIWVSLILGLLASGSDFNEILSEYPILKREDLLAVLAYGAAMSEHRFVDLPHPSAA